MKKRARKTVTRAVRVAEPVMQEVKTRLLSFLARRDSWNGTMTELDQAVTARLKHTPEYWPSTPSVLRRVVNQAVPAIRKAGFRVQFSRTPDHDRKRIVSFSRN